MKLTLPYWYDLHTHLRQDDLLAPIIASQGAMGCAGFLAMPNTKPPVAKVFEDDDLPYWSLEEYRTMIMRAGGDEFSHIITPLYLLMAQRGRILAIRLSILSRTVCLRLCAIMM